MKRWMFVFAVAAAVTVVPLRAEEPSGDGPVVVAAWQFDDLKKIVERLQSAVKLATVSNNNAEVIPRQSDRNAFLQDMERVRRVADGRGGIDQWIDDVRRQTPLPTDSRKYYVRDFSVMGFGANEEAASDDLRKECKALDALLKDAYETSYAGTSCGSGAQKYGFDGGKVVGLMTRAIVVVRIPRAATVETRTGDWIQSGNIEAGLRNYRAWQENCRSWLFDQFNLHGEKLVGATCGVIESPTSYSLQSQGRIFLKK